MAQQLDLTSASAPRGVHKLRGTLLGMNMYVAVTSDRRPLGDCIHLASAGGDAQLVTRLRDQLDVEDPRRTHLRLVPDTVTAAIDGPSPSHPQMRDIGDELREMLEKVRLTREASPAADIDTAITHDVVRLLSESLYGRSA